MPPSIERETTEGRGMTLDVLSDALFDGNAQRNRLLRLDTPLGADWSLRAGEGRQIAHARADGRFVLRAAA